MLMLRCIGVLSCLALIVTNVQAALDGCTTIVSGPKAGIHGPMTTHTADCMDCDFRISKMPAKDWPAGSYRPLYLYREEYPGVLSPYRGETWLPSNLEGTPAQLEGWGTESPITGYIPQVPHTYALFEAGYGIMNEFQVAIGESTCASVFWAAPTTAGGKAAIDVRQMSMIALERSTTARQAIQLMGDLAVQYGFYGADWSGGDDSLGEGGETLTVVDKTESWVFHVLADDTGTSAVWVAQRVPDDHVSAIANQFVIRAVNQNSPDFMYSSNLWAVASRNNLWDSSYGYLDFKHTYGRTRGHPPYATRRVWRVFNMLAPSITLPANSSDEWGDLLPFSVKVDARIGPEDLMRVQRDHYEGTPFDLTQGLAAGPYGDPARFDPAAQPDDNLTIQEVNMGGFERAISLYRTSYSIVATPRSSVPNELALVWISQYAPHSASYVPFYVASRTVPTPFMRGSLFKYDPSTTFWNFCAVGNYAARFYKYAFVDVRAMQAKLQTEAMEAVAAVEAEVAATITVAGSNSRATVVEMLTAFTSQQADKTLTTWRDFFGVLITTYHDGYRAENLGNTTINMYKLFYPKFWLDSVGFFNTHKNTDPKSLEFGTLVSSNNTIMLVMLTAVASSSIALFAGIMLERRWKISQPTNRRQYQPIDEL